MTMFYLKKIGDRTWIDAMPGPADVRNVDAVEWLAAKKEFGFELSPIQAYLLEKHQKERERFQREAA